MPGLGCYSKQEAHGSYCVVVHLSRDLTEDGE